MDGCLFFSLLSKRNAISVSGASKYQQSDFQWPKKNYRWGRYWCQMRGEAEISPDILGLHSSVLT